MDQINRRAWVSGIVQGVWYRASTRTEAKRLQVNGYAKNLPDGRVEVLMSGSRDAVETLSQWLQVGPPRAKVTQVIFEDLPFEQREGFDTA